MSYATFEASDDAITNMHGQVFGNKEITVQYAYKKDGKGERHGDAAERALAAQAKLHGVEVNIPAMPAALVAPVPTAPVYPQAQVPYYPQQSGPGGYNVPHDRNSIMNMGPPSFGPSYSNQTLPSALPGYYGQAQVYPLQAPYGPPQHQPTSFQQGQYPQDQYQQTQFQQPQLPSNMMPPPSFVPSPQPGFGPSRSNNASPYGAPPPGAGLPQRPGSTNAGPGGPHRPNTTHQSGPSATGRS